MNGIQGRSSREAVSDFCQALSAGRARAALDLLDPRATWWVGGSVPGLSGTRVGRDVTQMVSGILDLTTDGALLVAPWAWTVDGGRVALEALVTATLRDGAIYNNEYHFLFEVRGGLIWSVRAYLDTEHLRSVFGSA